MSLQIEVSAAPEQRSDCQLITHNSYRLTHLYTRW